MTAWRLTVKDVEHRTRKQHVGGVGKDATFRDVSHGWWIVLEETNASLYAGENCPEIKSGDVVKLTLSKI